MRFLERLQNLFRTEAYRERLQQEADSVRREDPQQFSLDLPTSLQMNDYSCSVECLYSVLQFFEIDIPRRTVAQQIQVSRWFGASEDKIMRVLRQHKLAYKVIENGTPRELSKAIRSYKPVIVALDNDAHWAVVYGVSRRFIHLMDPDPARMHEASPTRSEFRKRWDGWGIVVS